jgi:hypothetical protein
MCRLLFIVEASMFVVVGAIVNRGCVSDMKTAAPLREAAPRLLAEG